MTDLVKWLDTLIRKYDAQNKWDHEEPVLLLSVKNRLEELEAAAALAPRGVDVSVLDGHTPQPPHPAECPYVLALCECAFCRANRAPPPQAQSEEALREILVRAMSDGYL